MKQATITISFLLLPTTFIANAQEFETNHNLFVTEGKIWTCNGYSAISPDTGRDYYERLYYFQGDSIINGVVYKCLHCRNEYIGGVRQDKISYLLRQERNKVYTHKGNVLYDFELKVGESSQDGWLVTSVGDTVFNDNVKRRFLKVKYENTHQYGETSYAYDIWVEGLGSLNTGIAPNKDPQKMGGSLKLQGIAQNGTYIYNKTAETHRINSMLTENKVWHSEKWKSGSEEKDNIYYQIVGDTVINDRLCKKMYAQYGNENTKKYYLASMYEDGYKVFICHAGQQSFNFLYDFGVNMGERVVIGNTNLKVTGTDEININGTDLRRIHLTRIGTGESEYSTIWVEGFGNLINPICPVPASPGTYESLLDCKINGENELKADVLYTPLKTTSWLGSVWSYVAYNGNDYEFTRYTVLDEPKTINGKIYLPLVQYVSCEYSPEKELERWYIRQENNIVYMNSNYEKFENDEIFLNMIDDDYILYDFNYVKGKDYCYASTPETISMTDTVSVYDGDGKQHRFIMLDYGKRLIDGIGSAESLVRLFTLSEPDCICGSELNFFRTADGKVMYKNTNTDEYAGLKKDDCALAPNAIDCIIRQKESVQIQVTGASFHCTSPDAIKLEVYTMDAVKVGEARFVNGEATIKVGSTPALYLYIVTYPDGHRESGKVVANEE